MAAVATVIMAGGRGERFWPKSREDLPKQFLSMESDRSLLQRTVSRLTGLCNPNDVWVVTQEAYAELVRKQLPSLQWSQLITEPTGRDTAACIALAALRISQLDPETIMVVLPADHLVTDEQKFRECLRQAIDLASNGDCLVTLGIRPTRPETAYGYIRTGDRVPGDHQAGAVRVAGFTEKPSLDTANGYLRDGGYLWNSGMFVWRASVIQRALRDHLPKLMKELSPLVTVCDTPELRAKLAEVYVRLPKVSIDRAVMEKTEQAIVIPVDFGWDDLGSWGALERLLPRDEYGNVLSGNAVALNADSSIVSANTGRLVVLFGVSELVVVETSDVVLVMDKSRVSDVRSVVQHLEVIGLGRHVRHVSD